MLTAREARRRIDLAIATPAVRHPLPGLVPGAWRRRDRLRLVDALYVELASQLGLPRLTTDAALARATTVAVLV